MRNIYLVTMEAEAVDVNRLPVAGSMLSSNLKYSRDGNKDGLAVFSSRKCAMNYIKIKKQHPIAARREYQIQKVSIK